ncbi:DUF2889 domain-containing protein [Duganella sp. FT92W]|uniref:DUF2889 domain-containing protein n=1 Tax=Pseudoduganella rivuli TaxID=2666085 RepID=A0A7X2IIN4_9BURK|nr:DUF2889 domain-containing protein [Pseudoduganella rivuli]MRV70526.1 DUF2889 domain-containing protein [Pseudoduganella rivuli]
MTSFRRSIHIATRLEGPGTGSARAALEDDFHHFRVELAFAAGVVARAHGSGLRIPYTGCAAAGAALAGLAGMRLDSVANSVTRATDASQQCTHQLDLAGLALAAAARGISARRYDIDVPRRIGKQTSGRIDRDGVTVLDWRIDGETIVAPQEHAGVSLRDGFARWALTSLPEDVAEAALILRRCLMISRGRERDLDVLPHAEPSGRCFAQQPQRAVTALRVVGSTWDFTERAGELCAEDRAFLQAV